MKIFLILFATLLYAQNPGTHETSGTVRPTSDPTYSPLPKTPPSKRFCTGVTTIGITEETNSHGVGINLIPYLSKGAGSVGISSSTKGISIGMSKSASFTRSTSLDIDTCFDNPTGDLPIPPIQADKFGVPVALAEGTFVCRGKGSVDVTKDEKNSLQLFAYSFEKRGANSIAFSPKEISKEVPFKKGTALHDVYKYCQKVIDWGLINAQLKEAEGWVSFIQNKWGRDVECFVDEDCPELRVNEKGLGYLDPRYHNRCTKFADKKTKETTALLCRRRLQKGIECYPRNEGTPCDWEDKCEYDHFLLFTQLNEGLSPSYGPSNVYYCR